MSVATDVYFITTFNSLSLGQFEWNFRYVVFKQTLEIDGWGISSEIALIWISLDFTADQSTLVKVMAWCRQATSHNLSQSWPRYLSPYDITRHQRVSHNFCLSYQWKIYMAAGSFVVFSMDALFYQCIVHTHFNKEPDMSTTRRRLKSLQSICGTSTHPSTVTHRSRSWS